MKLILISPIALVGLNAFRAMAIHTAGVFIACFMVLYFLNKLFRLNRPLRTARFNLKEVFRFSLPVYFSQVLNVARWQLLIILLGILSNSVAVGTFLAALRISMIGILFFASIKTVAMPQVAELYSENKIKELGHFYRTIIPP